MEVTPLREGDGVGRDPDPPGATGDLGSRFLARDEQTGLSGGGHRRQPLEQQRGLPDPRWPGQQDHGPRDQPPAEHPVQVRQAGRKPNRLLGARLDQRDDGPRGGAAS
jgi:hypothetical protein